MAELNCYLGLADYLTDIGNLPFASCPLNEDSISFAKERERRNIKLGTIVQRYLLTERRLSNKVEGLEKEFLGKLGLAEPVLYGNFGKIMQWTNEYREKIKSTRKKLEDYRRDNSPAYIQAKQVISESCLFLVVYWAKKYAEKFNLNVNDLIGYGNRGLMHAVEKFNPKRKCLFSTYATFWIRQSISRGIADEECKGNFSLSYPMYKKRGKILKIEELLFSELGRNPNEEETARKYNEVYCLKDSRSRIKLEDVKVLRALRRVSRLSLLGCDKDREFDVEDIRSEASFEIAARNDGVREVLDYLDNSGRFTSDEIEVIKYRFGIERDPRTLKETGTILKLTRERIRQIEAKALQKLKNRFDPMYRQSLVG
ncbi:sigma-70 family RNA polymerase sigma factor [Candidatus Pacearchaeota archaeon]|nr:sigma-70 family RNA polymerase sigma factor [Candidatus Pacearchaeota archaeon]